VQRRVGGGGNQAAHVIIILTDKGPCVFAVSKPPVRISLLKHELHNDIEINSADFGFGLFIYRLRTVEEPSCVFLSSVQNHHVVSPCSAVTIGIATGIDQYLRIQWHVR